MGCNTNINSNAEILLIEANDLVMKLDEFVNGGPNDTVTTKGGPVKTLANIADTALSNGWVLKVIDVPTLEYLDDVLAGYVEGQLFRVYGYINPAKNGLYQKEGNATRKIGLVDLVDIIGDAEYPYEHTANGQVKNSGDYLDADLSTNLKLRFAKDSTSNDVLSYKIYLIAKVVTEIVDVKKISWYDISSTQSNTFDGTAVVPDTPLLIDPEVYGQSREMIKIWVRDSHSQMWECALFYSGNGERCTWNVKRFI